MRIIWLGPNSRNFTRGKAYRLYSNGPGYVGHYPNYLMGDEGTEVPMGKSPQNSKHWGEIVELDKYEWLGRDNDPRYTYGQLYQLYDKGKGCNENQRYYFIDNRGLNRFVGNLPAIGLCWKMHSNDLNSHVHLGSSLPSSAVTVEIDDKPINCRSVSVEMEPHPLRHLSMDARRLGKTFQYGRSLAWEHMMSKHLRSPCPARTFMAFDPGLDDTSAYWLARWSGAPLNCLQTIDFTSLENRIMALIMREETEIKTGVILVNGQDVDDLTLEQLLALVKHEQTSRQEFKRSVPKGVASTYKRDKLKGYDDRLRDLMELVDKKHEAS